MAEVQGQEAGRGSSVAGLPLWAVAFLGLAAVVSLMISKYRILGGDDFLELWCDHAPSIARLFHIQSSLALVVDPFFYHALMYVDIRMFGLNPVLLRLPSLLGFMAMQLCLFYFVRRIAPERAAIFAMGFPMITGAFQYTAQLRAYGLLLGLYGIAMLCWQTAVRRQTNRAWPLIVLALTIAIVLNTHYFGCLLLLPLCAGEVVRLWQSRRVDRPMLLSLCAGMAGIVFILPLLNGAAEFRRNNGPPLTIPLRVITQTYNFVLLGYAQFGVTVQHVLVVVLGLFLGLVVWGSVRQWRNGTLALADAEFAFLLVLAAMPFFSFLLSHFVTHAQEPRYSLGAVIGIAALLSFALLPVLRSDALGRLVVVLLFAACVIKGVAGIREQQQYQENAMSMLGVSPEIRAAIAASPTQRLYTQDVDLLGFVSYYEPDPELRSQLAFVYSRQEEMRWTHSQTSARLAEHMKEFTPFTILPYESVAAQPGEHIFVVTNGGWNWIDHALATEHVDVKVIGQAFGCDVVSVRFL